ncbi:MAG: V-type sodium ATP synthase subunit C [candidate division TA06 bacterium 32_111]|uniref:V-type sodium ATP synthase subunit C n=2 Tax=Bacteria candidate phyla TaxID=1783234 RepID=A0A117M6R6_UNCT6|nr:MAG: V-type sodium ATP synthase subunit C [candidate division TA06 bacterium 32_111]KUK87417.1 MAG: V-type sodium ATP synthase subunit C [candidate division TA06 bacterium 34_109]HAF07749.1 hypothetical protein [candidate division WOR-3 bacterium]HCP17267.1 hypothetical protein [candidate division WOR-3 bacterium]
MNSFEVKLKENTEYLFSFGELVQREREFLSKDQFERLITSNSFDEFVKNLSETYYSVYTEDLKKQKDFSFVMEKENFLTIDYLQKNLLEKDRKLINFLTLDRDIHNVKVVVKSTILGKDLKEIFLHSTYSYESLKESYESGNFEKLEGNIKDVLEYAYFLKPEKENLRIVELKLEQLFFKKLLKYISLSGSELLLKLFRHRVDMLNIKNVYRVKISSMNIKSKDFIYPEGYLPLEFFEEFDDENLDYFASELEKSIYVRMIMEGAFLAFSEKTFTSFEKNEEKFVLDFLSKSEEFLPTLERILFFFIKKRFETRSLNIIFTGVVNNIPKDKIRNRIPQL